MKNRAKDNRFDDDEEAFQVYNDDLESGVCRSSTSAPRVNGHSHQSDSEGIGTQTTDEPSAQHQPTPAHTELETSSTFVPNKIAKTKPDQNPADELSSSPPTGLTTALSTPASSTDSSTRQHKQHQTPTAVSSQSHNTTIIFNQASWVTGLSAALAATTTSANNNSNSTDDQPVQTPRYIPYIEFENYSTYGNLIFDLNTGLSRTARVDCKPDGLEKAPPEALEEQFVRISPSRDPPFSSALRNNTTNGKDRFSTAPAQRCNDTDGTTKDCQDGDRTLRRGKKLGSFSEKNKKKKKKKKKEPSARASLEGHDESDNEQFDQRLKIKIIPPQSSSNTKTIEASSTSTSSHVNLPHNRPPSSLAGGTINNRPPSSFSFAAQSEDNRSASASEAHSLEPWAVPRSGRFWGHDDRQSYHRRGSRGFFQNQGGSSSARGTLRKRGGFRADWPATSPSSRKSHGSTHRPGTPAGQSDTGRSVGSGAGWITVPSKQKASVNGFQHQHSQLDSQRQYVDPGDIGEWRHDGWEEIEREADRKLHSSNRGRGGFHQSRGTAGWRGGAPASGQPRRPTTNLNATSESPSMAGKVEVSIAKSSASASISTPRGKEADEIKVSFNPIQINESSRASNRDGSTKIVNGDHMDAGKTQSPPTVETITRTNQSPSLSPSATPSTQPKPVLVQLPKAIKIGTIPVYPPAALQSPATERTEIVIKSQPPSSPNDHSSSSVPSLGQAPSTPDLSDTPQVCPSASTLEDHPYQKSDPILTPVSTEAVSGPITLGSAGGAEVLREAMSTPKLPMPAYPHPPHDGMIPLSRVDYPTRGVNSQHGGHSRSSSVNSHPLLPVSYGHHRPDFVEQPSHLRQPPPPHNFTPNHPSHLGSSNGYHNSIPLPPPPPPHSTIHQSGHFYHHQPSLPPIPPLQYFESHNHNAGYPHPPSFGPLQQTNHVYGSNVYFPPPPPPPPQQLGPSRAHPPIFHSMPPPTAAAATFEATPPPTLPPPPAPPAPASPGMTLPGHFAPPKSTKVRISHPGAAALGGGGNGPDDSFYFASHKTIKPILSSSTPVVSSDTPQIKTTETGISYYEYNGVTYFGDSLPPHLTAPGPDPTSGLIAAETHHAHPAEEAHHHNTHHHTHQPTGRTHHESRSSADLPRYDEYPIFQPYPATHVPPHFPHYHHAHYHHLFGFNGLRNHHNSTDEFVPLPPLPMPPNHGHPGSNLSGHPPPASSSAAVAAPAAGGSGGQVVLSQVIRPLGIPFG
ncbi:hypothetical protein VP01_170g7 [Puccinia sorghi]|uniref:Uncharacterized protein n=1 Tax=Puccinia sorghi TaxID=27349 RepID=A0A0L6VG55_9BASI|nr:hypothetical protein VP01_170g7 [Puccinia sorghi]